MLPVHTNEMRNGGTSSETGDPEDMALILA